MRNTRAYLIPLGCALALTVVTCTKPEEPLEPSFAVSSCVLTLTQAQTNPLTVPANSTWNQASWFIKNTGTGAVSLTGQQLSAVPKPPITAVRLIAWTSFPTSLAPGEQIDAEIAFDVGASGTGSVGLTVKTSCAGDKALPAYSVAVSGPVVMSAIMSAPASDRAAVMWTTNAASNSSVDYGLSSGYGSTTPVQPAAVTAHTVLLTGLVPQKVYHYRVRSGTTVSGDRTFSTSPAGTLAAFPGAQGAGATATGGRGGTIMLVKNLSDAGFESLRACMEGTGERICIIRVFGTIQLMSPIIVTNPKLTVAGQTAPGGGIMVRCKNLTSSGGCIRVQANDVILRYFRARVGKGLGKDALMLHNKSQKVVADHLSLSWASDENISVWNGTNSPTSDVQRDITLSWLLAAEALAGHSAAFLTGAQGTDLNYTNSHTFASLMTNIDMHHSMTANHTHRAPLYKNKSSRLVNNIIYNNDYHSTQLKGGISVDIIGNVYKKGTNIPDNPHEINAFDVASNNAGAVKGAPLIHLSGNKGWNQPSAGGYQWSLARRTSGENLGEIDTIPEAWRRGPPLALAGVPIIADAADDIEAMLTGGKGVGASARLDCDGGWVGNRDAVDDRLMRDYAVGYGRYPGPTNYEDVEEFGWPTMAPGTACTDSDNDGMPNTWETANGLNPTNKADANTTAANGSGYTNLDMYLAGMRAK